MKYREFPAGLSRTMQNATRTDAQGDTPETQSRSRSVLTQDALKELLSYDPDTGEFIWIRARPNFLGKRAGWKDARGMTWLRLNGHLYPAASLAWLFMTGDFPTKRLAHMNNDSSDVRWRNLKQATRSQIQGKQRLAKDNSSGAKGVTWDKGMRRWRAQINRSGKRTYLGLYATIDEASAAYRKAALQEFGEFATAVSPPSARHP